MGDFHELNEIENGPRLVHKVDAVDDDNNSDQSPTGTFDDLQEDQDAFIADSIEPLNKKQKGEKTQDKDTFKDYLSFALSVFNLMNAILGSGILGLAEAVKNLGILPFITLLLLTALLASYTINMLLHMSQVCSVKSYEGLAQRSFGYKGKLATTIIIILHCLGAMCSYVFIVKAELPEVVKVLGGYESLNAEEMPWFMDGNFLMMLVVLLVIVPLAAMKDIKFLGYSSAFGMTCMLLFTFTVVAKKFTIPCPLPVVEHLALNVTNSSLEAVGAAAASVVNLTTSAPNSSHHALVPQEEEEEQYCAARTFTLNSRTAYAVPTMFFSFMCHASMLPIYAELRRPSIKKMQRVANVSIVNVLVLYITASLFGYMTFFNRVESELLLTYSKFNPSDAAILVSRVMVIICVTLSVPLLHYPARKTIILTFCHNPQNFSWFRHIVIMLGFITVTVLLVLFIPNIRDIFGMAGATTSASLLVILPSAFLIKSTGAEATPSVRKKYALRRKFAIFLCVFGFVFMFMSIGMIVKDWLD